MKVRNIKGNRSEHYRSIGINEWKKHKGTSRNPTCSAIQCGETATDGAHVKKVDSPDGNWYICPLCHRHNESTEDIELKVDWKDRLVPLQEL